MVAASAAPPTKPPAAPTPTSSRAKLSTTKLPDSAHSASDTTQASVPQRTAADSPKRLISFDGDQRAGEIAGGVDGVHEARGGIRPAQRIAHVRQHQRIGEAADAEADRSAPATESGSAARDARAAMGGRGLSRDSPAGAALWQARPAIAQAHGGNGVLPFAQCRSSNPRAILVVMAGLRPGNHVDGRKTMTRRGNQPWRPINSCFSPATASAPK